MFAQWHLDPAPFSERSSGNVASEKFDTPLPPEWIWCDPAGGCSFDVDGSLTIESRAARDLWSFFVGAPRKMRLIEDDFITQVTCKPARTDRPGVGGILLWQNKSNFLRLCIGVRAQDEMSLDGCIANRDVVIGRGRLATGPITLRMERSRNTVRALCRAVGQEWFRIGTVEFPTSGPLQIGLVAIGFPDHTIYQAPYSDGTAIRFTDFLLWS